MAKLGPPKPRRVAVSPPPGSTHWSCTAIEYQTQKNAEGKKYNNAKQKRMTGRPNEDGSVPEVWPISEFSTLRVLEAWGPGRYRVDWYGSDNEKISSDTFLVDKPPSAAKPARRVTRPIAAPDGDEMVAASDGLPSSPIGWIMMMQQRDDAAREQRRQEAAEEERRREAQFERQRAADREYTAQLISALRGGGGGGGGTSADDMALLRREMAVTVREQMGSLRGEMAAALGQIQQNRGEDDGPDDLADGAERIGLRLLGELEDAAPDIIEAAIPGIVALLQGRGWKPSAAFQNAIEALRNKQNGAS